MRDISDDKIKKMLASMTPDDIEDAKRMEEVSIKLIDFMHEQNLRTDLWIAILMGFHRIIYEKSVQPSLKNAPETFEEYLIQYATHSLKFTMEA